MTIDRADHPPSTAVGAKPTVHEGSLEPLPLLACPYLGQVDDEFTYHLQPHAEHRCHAVLPAARIEDGRQLRHCLSDHKGCSRFVPPVDGRRAEPAEIAAANGFGVVSADLSPEDWDDPSTGARESQRDSDEVVTSAGSTAPVSWLKRRSFEEWLIIGVTIGLLGVITYVALLGGPSRPVSGERSPAIEAVIAALDATNTPTPSPEPTITPRPTSGPELALATVAVPTPPAGGLTAALSPVERGVASFNARDRLPASGQRELSVGTFEGQRYLGGILFSLSKLPRTARIDYVALELAGLSDTSLAEGDWTVEMLDPEAADGWSDLTHGSLEAAPATEVGRAWTIPGEQLAPRRINVLEFSDEARDSLISRLEQGRVAFRLRGPERPEDDDNLFIWDTGFGEGFGTRPVLRINFVPPTPTPGAASGRPTAAPLIVWIGKPTPAPTSTPLPGSPLPLLDGMILFLSDRFGGSARLMVYDPVGDRIGQVTQPWVYEVARNHEQSGAQGRLVVYDVPCGDGGATIEDKEGRPIPNPDPARRCQQIAVHDGSDGPPREVTESGWTHYDPAFSLDEQWLVYVSQITGNDEVFKIRSDGTGNTRLTENEWPWDKHPSFSPDGQSVVFWSNRDGHRQLYVMGADGSGVRRLLTGPWDDWDPVWVK